MRYRPDIDGLRGVAVICVLLFHAKAGPFPGGFAGVDIFFVISGFLIASQISQQLREGRFTFARFFERRVRRLFPALFAVIAFSTLAGYRWLLPQDLGFLGTSQIYSALFSSNILFWKISFKYFSEGALFPLLHTWSLGVEEQFYIVVPFAFVFLYRRSSGVTLVSMWVFAIISYIAFAWGTLKASPGAFYLAPLRAWEFVAGALLAVAPPPRPGPGRWRFAFETAGVLLILGAVVRKAAGPIGLLLNVTQAVLGTSVLIWTGTEGTSFVRRLLSSRLCRGTGLISYSLYLWHWPILTFLAAHLSRNPTVAESLGAIAAAFPISYLSWRFIETPFRASVAGIDSQKVRLLAEASTLAILISGFSLRHTSGFPDRLPIRMREFIQEDSGPKRFASREEVQRLAFPRIGTAAPSPPRILIWGDSHAEAASPALDILSDAHQRPGVLAAWPACPPLLRLEEPLRRFGSSRECRSFNEAVMRTVSKFGIQDVILAAQWAGYEPDSPRFESDLRTTVESLTDLGARVWILEDNPQLPFHPVRRAFRLNAWEGVEGQFGSPRADHEQRNAAFHTAASRIANDVPVRLLNSTSEFCDGSTCRAVRDGKLLYRDTHHVNRLGSYRLVPALEEAFAAAAATL